ncbi:hypothetical protein FF2_025260 [Malus domestica]
MSEPSYKIRPVSLDPNYEPNKDQARLSKLQSEFPPPSVPSTCSNTITLATGDGSAPAIRPVARQQRLEDQFRINSPSNTFALHHSPDRLIPILSASAASSSVLDFQDILQRFGFDNICRIAFGYDPDYLLPSLPEAKFAVAFNEAVQISSDRLRLLHPVWKLKRALGIGSEKRLRAVESEVREFAKAIVREKKRDLSEAKVLGSVDLLSRFLSSGHTDAKFVTDIVISFTLAGRDTTSAALTWFFWLLSQNPCAENEILRQINEAASSELAAGGVLRRGEGDGVHPRGAVREHEAVPTASSPTTPTSPPAPPTLAGVANRTATASPSSALAKSGSTTAPSRSAPTD